MGDLNIKSVGPAIVENKNMLSGHSKICSGIAMFASEMANSINLINMTNCVWKHGHQTPNKLTAKPCEETTSVLDFIDSCETNAVDDIGIDSSISAIKKLILKSYLHSVQKM